MVEVPLTTKLVLHRLQVLLRLCRIHGVLIHWYTGVWRSNEYLEFFDLSCGSLSNLDSRCAVADYGHSFVFHVHTLIGPERRMADIALIVVKARPVWKVSFRCEAKTAVHEACGDFGAIVALNMPFVGFVVPAGFAHTSVVDRVLADVADFVDMLEVSL